ncbi:MAG TPA: hybrid sensor histidine kinase/response regulator [Planctomycetaceae bacterium]|nr:hybrid sensor histidine kinase/response regulator [Planctomycetaceae bacterium]
MNQPINSETRFDSNATSQIHDALWRSEQRYRALLEATSQAVWSWSPHGGATEFDRSQKWWEELTGQTMQQQTRCADAWLDALHPDDRPLAQQSWIEASTNREAYEIVYRVVGRLGGWKYVRARGVPIVGPDNRIREWIGTLDDVTAQHEAAIERDRLLCAAETERYRLEEVFLHAPSFMAVLRGPKHVFERVNDRYKQLIGGRDVIGLPMSEALPELADQGYIDFLDKVYSFGKTHIASDAKMLLKNPGAETERILQFVFQPMFDALCNVTGVIVQGIDMTEQRQAEEELRDIRSRMEAALEAGAIGTWNWDVVADRFYCDNSLARIFSLSSERIVAGDSVSHVVQKIHPDDRAHVQQKIDSAVLSSNRYEASYRVINDDGTWKWITARGKIDRDESGKALRFPGVVIDVTDWKRAEEELARLTVESERRKRLYETFLSSIPDFAYVFDLDHKFCYANDVLLKTWGRTWDEAIGKTCHELGYEKWHAEMHDREIEQVKLTRQPQRGEVPFNGTFGRRDYEYIFVPVIGNDGEVEAIAGTTRDVTDRKLAEEALREVARRKDDFLAILAHELRNPLAPIRNGLQVMRTAQADKNAIANVRDMMERQLAHLVRLIDDLLDISRITTNKMQLRCTQVSIADIIETAVETAGPAIQEADHHLEIALPPYPIMLYADITRLGQVFSNLLNNSAKYTPRGGTILLSVETPQDNHVVITVRDNGIGIPESELPTLFDMFSQVDRSLERSCGGLGIGLSLVKGLVEMHHGTVAATSVEGRGSTLTVRLPTVTSELSDSLKKIDEDAGDKPSRRVMVVDDNRDGANSMAIVLRLLGNDVTIAHDGIEAIEIAESFLPEIILMDIGLPRLNGLEATRRIREQPWGKSIKIFALTGWGQEHDRQRSHDAGCNGHLVKPVDPSELRKLLA